MLQPAAGRICTGRIERSLAFLDVLNLTFRVHHERGPVGHSIILDQHAVFFGNLSLVEIAQERKCQIEFFREFLLGGSVVGADSEDLGVLSFKFGDTSLVRRQFLRSTTGERGWEERQHYGLFPSVV